MNRESSRKKELVKEGCMFLNPSQDSRKKSIIESITDIVIGFLMYLPINFFVLPMFSDQIANQEIVGFLQITAVFTMVAFVRKYTIRRWFAGMKF
jgi:hypothetical protein